MSIDLCQENTCRPGQLATPQHHCVAIPGAADATAIVKLVRVEGRVDWLKGPGSRLCADAAEPHVLNLCVWRREEQLEST